MRCPNCKTELKQDDVYCYQCGTKINWFWRFKTHLIAVAVVVIVLAGGTITGVTLYRNGVFDAKKDTVAEQPAQTQAPSKKGNKTEKSAIQTAKPTAAPGQVTKDTVASDFVAVDKTKEIKPKLKDLTEQTAPFLSLCVRWKDLGGGKFTWDNQVATQAVLYDMLYGDPASGTGEMHVRGYDNSYAGIARRVKKEMKARYGDCLLYTSRVKFVEWVKGIVGGVWSVGTSMASGSRKLSAGCGLSAGVVCRGEKGEWVKRPVGGFGLSGQVWRVGQENCWRSVVCRVKYGE